MANILGLGWAATPAGLKAMKELAQLEKERGNYAFYEEKTGNKEAAENDEIAETKPVAENKKSSETKNNEKTTNF